MAEQALNGKIVIISGRGGEVELALARAFALAGSRAVILAAPGDEGTRVIVQALQDEGYYVQLEALQVDDPVQSSRVVGQVAEQFGQVDVLVNAGAVVGGIASHSESQPAVESLPATEWEATLAAVVSSTFYYCQAAGRQMLAQGHGVIANLVSVQGLKAIEGRVSSSVAHTALVALTKALGVEWAGRGVRVIGVALPLEMGLPSRRTPLRQAVTAEHIAEALLYLVSDEAAYVTAEVMVVDGGWNAYQLF